MARSTEFGILLRAYRKKRELNREDFGKLVGFAEWTIVSWEIGRLPPALDSVKDIAERLGFLPGSEHYDKLVNAALADRAAAQGSALSQAQASVEPTPVVPTESADMFRLLPGETEVRYTLRLRVYQYWVEGMLDPLRKIAPLIPLALEYTPTTAQDRWHEAPLTQNRQQVFVESRELIDLLNVKGGLLAIVGKPGAGKTTTLIECADELLAQAAHDLALPIPVIFPLRSWAKRQLTLGDWLEEELQDRYGISLAGSRQLIAERTILYLFDGLDEVESPVRIACIEAINDFMRDHHPKALLCCRSKDFQQLQQHLLIQGRASVQPLKQEQIDNYLDCAGQAGAALKITLQHDPDLALLATSPLMLHILLQVRLQSLEAAHQGHDSVQISSVTIWQMYLERMLTKKRRDALVLKHREADGSLEAEQPRDALSSLQATYRNQAVSLPGQVDPESQDLITSIANEESLQTRRWLSWMAGYLQQSSQHELRVDQLQVEALPPLYRWQYVVLDRLGVALLTGALFSLGLAAIIVAYGLVSGKYSSYYADIPSDVLVFGVLGVLIGGLFDAGSPSRRRMLGRRRFAQLLIHCLFSGVVFGAIGYALTGLPGSAVVFASAALCAAILTRDVGLGARYIDVVSLHEWSWARSRQMLPLGTTIGTIGGLVAAFTVGQADGILGQILSIPVANIFAGLFLGMLTSLMFGFTEHGPREKAAKFNEGIIRSARNARIGGMLGAFIGACFGLLVGAGPVTWLIVAWSGGITAALGFGGYACLSHVILRFLLWRHNLFPWNYAPFFNDCTERMLLHRIGGGVQFFHPMLAQYLSTSAEPESLATIRVVENSPPTGLQRPGRMTHVFAHLALWKALVVFVACSLYFSVPPASQRATIDRIDPAAFDLTIQRDVVVFEQMIHTGDRITIIPSGLFYMGPYSGITTTRGKDRDGLGFPFGKVFNLVQTAPMASLLCRVETITDRRVGRAWQICDTPMTFTAANNGQLMFLINTTDSPNHRGYYEVKILVEPGSSSQPASP